MVRRLPEVHSAYRATARSLVRRQLRVQYTLAGTDLLLHRIGWSVQVTARRAGERDEAAPPILESPPFKLTCTRWAEEHLTEGSRGAMIQISRRRTLNFGR
jgi:hypothetical protein